MKSRRWLRFSLRTFFVLLMLLGVALGWAGAQLRWIRERRAAREWIDAHGQRWEEVAESAEPPPLVNTAPWSLQLFGEYGEFEIEIEPQRINVSEPSWDVNEIRRLFPEAHVREKPEEQWEPNPLDATRVP